MRSVAAGKLATAAAVKRPNTYAVHESHVRMHIVPALGGKQVRAVRRSDMQTMVNALVAGGLAPRTVHGIYTTAAALFREAHLMDRLIADNPCVGVLLPEIPQRAVQVLTWTVVKAVADEMVGATGARYRAAVLLAAGTGLRVSEVIGLTWDRIDLDGCTVTVDRQLNDKGLFAPVKTRKSRRVVPLPDVVVAVLRAHLVAYPPLGQDIGHTDGSTVHGARLVFSRADGRPLRQAVLRAAFYRARDAVGLGSDVTFHVLRHTFASRMIAQGTNSRALQEWMGHGSIKVTMDIYGHLFPDEHDRARAAMNAAFTD